MEQFNSCITIHHGDSANILSDLAEDSVDLVVTSPPYDNLRTYNGIGNGWNFDKFKLIANQLFRVLKWGGGNCMDCK